MKRVMDKMPTLAYLYSTSFPGLYRRPITVTAGSNGMPSNYSIQIVLDTASLISAGKMRSDCGDIRFYKSDGTPLSYYIEPNTINTSSTRIWVLDPDSLSANSSHVIYMYYGNKNLTSQSNPQNVFLFFQNFENGSVSDWVAIQGSGTNTADTSQAVEGIYSHKLFGSGSGSDFIVRKTLPSVISTPFVYEVWVREYAAYNAFSFYQSDGSTYITLWWRRDDAGRYKPEIRLTNGTLQTGLGIDNLDFNMWHRFRIYFNSSSDLRFNWLYNGKTDEGTYGPFSPSISNLQSITFGCYNYNRGQGWQDQIIIRKYVNPEPTITIGSEQTFGKFSDFI